MAILSFACLLLVSCIEAEPGRPDPDFTPEGPPTMQADVVERHAKQFDEELAPRPAGSQEEFAAATYITAHLQQAGYSVRLDAVPVADTVRSTNVIALPHRPPRYAVVVAYDTELMAGLGTGLGVFLELARALEVAAPDHEVAFVALGAEQTVREGSDRRLGLGSRRFVQYLSDEELSPIVIVFQKVGPGRTISVFGSQTDPGVCALANDDPDSQGPVCFRVSGTPSFQPDLYDAAGLDAVGVAGGPQILGDVLLRFFTAGDI